MTEDGRPVVLVAEDDADTASLLSLWLKDRYRVINASDGDAALSIAHQELPGAAIVDIMLPVLSGAGLAWAFQHHPRLCHIPVAYVTAYPDAARALPEGSRVLTKPFDRDTLLTLVDDLIRSAPPPDTTGEIDRRRRTTRVFLVKEAALEGERRVTGLLLSLSIMGACLQCNTPLPAGSMWTLTFTHDGKTYAFPVEIRYNIEAGGAPCVGLWMHDLGLALEQQVQGLVHELMMPSADA